MMSLTFCISFIWPIRLTLKWISEEEEESSINKKLRTIATIFAYYTYVHWKIQNDIRFLTSSSILLLRFFSLFSFVFFFSFFQYNSRHVLRSIIQRKTAKEIGLITFLVFFFFVFLFSLYLLYATSRWLTRSLLLCLHASFDFRSKVPY